jgi:hypothetical protein
MEYSLKIYQYRKLIILVPAFFTKNLPEHFLCENIKDFNKNQNNNY